MVLPCCEYVRFFAAASKSSSGGVGGNSRFFPQVQGGEGGGGTVRSSAWLSSVIWSSIKVAQSQNISPKIKKKSLRCATDQLFTFPCSSFHNYTALCYRHLCFKKVADSNVILSLWTASKCLSAIQFDWEWSQIILGSKFLLHHFYLP